MSDENRAPACLGYIGNELLPSYVGITSWDKSSKKAPYETTNTIECGWWIIWSSLPKWYWWISMERRVDYILMFQRHLLQKTSHANLPPLKNCQSWYVASIYWMAHQCLTSSRTCGTRRRNPGVVVVNSRVGQPQIYSQTPAWKMEDCFGNFRGEESTTFC